MLLELYKEVGLAVRQFTSEVYATNRLMLPPLVIGLLVLYGDVTKFLGVEFQNAEAVHCLVWFGCVIISLIWICNVSRLAQVIHWHFETMRQCECELGLIGHRKIAQLDEKLGVSKILRHNVLRFIGFWIYFSLLLNVLPTSIFFYETLIPWFSIVASGVLSPGQILLAGGTNIISIGVSAVLSFGIWCLYFFILSSETSSKTRCIASMVLLILSSIVLLPLFYFVMVCFLVYLWTQSC